MGNVIDFNKYKEDEVAKINNQISERYFLETVDIIVKDELHTYVYLFKTHKDGFARISPYTKFFSGVILGRSLLNKSANTKLNAYGKFIVRFLNYIFFERENKLTSMNEVDRNIAIEFLTKHAKGEVGNQKGAWIGKEESFRAGRAVMMFLYWLKYTTMNIEDDNGESIKMPKIKKSDFTIKEKSTNRKRSFHNGEIKESRYIEKIIACPEDFRKTSNMKSNASNANINTNKREKVINISLFTVRLLMDVAYKYDQEMLFPIVLGAFVGLRQGDVVQMNRNRINIPFDYDITESCTIDLLNEVQISNSTKDCGNIKTHRIQPIYEAFMPTVANAYHQHLKILESRGLTTHTYGALFFNRTNDGVMKQQSLNRRFDKIVKKTIEIIKEEAIIKNNIHAIKEYDVLEKEGYDIKFHSLRHYYTHALEKFEQNPFVLMKYRGDSSVESQNTYRSNMSTVDAIKKAMDTMEEAVKEYGYSSILPDK